MTAEVPSRKWALRRLSTGDYLCVSNDETLIWRFHTHQDGRSYGLVDVAYESRTFWRAIYMPVSRFTSLQPLMGVPEPWSEHWIEADWYLPTRQAAINRMLTHDPS